MTRFKPVRAGIIHLWDYVDQEFRFADGRMVLRGPNGSGKTKALEVLVPFVLDGNKDPRRLDPFSGEDRGMKRNLLWHDEAAGYGYCWLEFARTTAGGGREHVTIGVGLQARAESPDVKSWFFVTDGARGTHFDLVTDGRPLSQKGLTDALPPGDVIEGQAKYRQRIDERLFGLGQERYDAMIDLVLTLRRPQLAKGLDPEKLSAVLTAGLRPLDRDLLTDSARAFEDLERVQRDLAKLDRAARAVEEALGIYAVYLKAHAIGRLEAWREKAAEVSRAEAEIKGLDIRLARESQRAHAAREQLAADRQEQAAREAEKQGILGSAAYADLQKLEDLRAAARAAKFNAEKFETVLRRSDATWKKATAELGVARSKEETAAGVVANANRSTRTLAADARVSLPEADRPERAALVGPAQQRRTELTAVTTALTAWEGAVAQASQLGADADIATREEEQALQALRDAELARDSAREALHKALDLWAVGVATDDDRAVLHAGVDALGTDARRSLVEIFNEIWTDRRDHAREDESRARREVDVRDVRIAALEADIGLVASEQDDAPATLPFRPASRHERPGGPLWRLVRFRDDLAPSEAAGIEGALEAAGLLDAWVDLDDVPRPDATEDAFLRVGPQVAGPSLADFLVAEADGPVPANRVNALLRSISWGGSGDIAIQSGQYRLGPVAGAYRPEASRYIGATARAANRARKIALLQQQRDLIQVERVGWQAEIEAAAERQAVIRRIRDALPTSRRFEDADRVCVGKATALRAKRESAERARDAASAAVRKASQLQAALRTLALRHDLPSERPQVEEFDRLLAALQRSIDDLLRAWEAQDRAAREHASASEREANARADRDAAARDAEGASTAARELAERLAAIESTQGADAQALAARLGSLEDAIERAASAISDADEDLRGIEKGLAALSATLDGQRAKALLLVQVRDAARAQLDVFGRPDIGTAIGLGAPQPDEPDPLPRLLGEAVGDRSGSVEYQRSTRTQLENKLQALDNAMGVDYRAHWSTHDGIITVEVADGESRRAVAAFATGLRRRLDEQRVLLSAQERALFEDQLLGTLCGQLHERIGAARDLVGRMDVALRSRRMSSGHTVGIGWGLDPEIGRAERDVLQLLDREAEHIGPSGLERIRAWFGAEVARTREARPDRPFLEILEHAVDYRRWHRFVLSLVERDGTRNVLSTRRYNQLSGGEKAASLHLPLFAAAHAHFTSGRSTCPRLVALDEAFAGIDDTGRPELLSLLAEFDLDVFMTGYDLWATESSIPAIAHYDLHHDRDAGVVSAWLILWNGRETVEGDDAVRAMDEAVV